MSNFNRRQFAVLAPVMLAVAACSASQTPVEISIMRAAGIPASASGKSWMLPEAKRDQLLYVTDNGYSSVYVFSYPQGKPVGALTGVDHPTGECVDKTGDVWVVNDTPAEVIEYLHGGTNPISILPLPVSYSDPSGCSIDASSGDLAVGDTTSVEIFRKATGTPTSYTYPSFNSIMYCVYDDSGNLYVDDLNSGNTLLELPKNGSALIPLTINQTISPNSLHWEHGYLAVQSANGAKTHGPIPIYRVAIQGSGATVIGTTWLHGPRDRSAESDAQFWIQGKIAIGPVRSHGGEADRLIAFWHYPRGGNAVKVLHPSGVDSLWATVVSPPR